ncbi:MAG: substrate-binding domain-containing protein [Spirochaetales bacterium]|nr:substrate-binding domain-containing protein [Spirochaetales bacterium]
MKDNIADRYTLGLLLDWAGTHYQMKVWSGAADLCRDTNTNLICFVGGAIKSPYMYEKQRNKLYDLISEKNVDGIIVLTSTISHYVGYTEMLEFFSRYKSFPCVSVGAHMEGVASVVVDNEFGMRELMGHLIHVHGYERFAYIGGPEENTDAQQRYVAFKKMLDLNNLQQKESLYIQGDFNMLSGQAAVYKLLDDRKVDFDVVVAANDEMAVGAIAALRGRGYKIPEDIAVVGFDDIEINKSITPLITTVRQPLYQQGRIATETLLRLLNKADNPGLQNLPTELIIRESCGCFSRKFDKEIPITINTEVKEFDDAFTSRKTFLLEEIRKPFVSYYGDYSSFSRSSISSRIEELLNAFYSELVRKQPGLFVSVWKDILFQTIQSGLSLAFWSQALACLHRAALSLIQNQALGMQAEELVTRARKMLEESEKQVNDLDQLNKTRETITTRAIEEHLVSTINLADLLNLLERTLPKLGIKSCYLTLCEDEKDKRANTSLLILAFNEHGGIDIGEDGIIFSSSNLLPAEMLPKGRRFEILVDALDYSINQLGIVIFEMEPKGILAWDILRGRLRETVKGALLLKRVQSQNKALAKANQELHREVLERKRVEKALRDSELRLRAIIDANPIPLVIYKESNGRILYVNEYFGKTFGLDTDNISNFYIHNYFLEKNEVDSLHEKMKKLSREGYLQNYEVCMKKEDGTVFWVVMSLQTLLFNNELSIIAGFYDVTDRKRLEKELLEISGREQQRLGQELHDGLGQILTGVSYMCRVLHEQLQAKALEEAETAKEITELVNQTINLTKVLARGFFPVELDENGIISALQELADKTENQFKISCHFSYQDNLFINDNSTALHLYRIAQEAVHNAVKHGEPDNIYISIDIQGDKIVLTVRDDGKGLKEEIGDTKGMGLRIMEYRANMIDGKVDISRDRVKGTIVSCSAPHPASNISKKDNRVGI